MEQAATDSQQTIDGFRSQLKTYLFRLAYPPTLVIPWRALFRCQPMPVPGLSLLGLKRIRGFVSILRYINPTIIIIIKVPPTEVADLSQAVSSTVGGNTGSRSEESKSQKLRTDVEASLWIFIYMLVLK